MASGPPSSDPLSTRMTGPSWCGMVSNSRARRLRVATTMVTSLIIAAAYPYRPGTKRELSQALELVVQVLLEEVDEAVRVRTGVLQDDVVEARLGVLLHRGHVRLGVRAQRELAADVLLAHRLRRRVEVDRVRQLAHHLP